MRAFLFQGGVWSAFGLQCLESRHCKPKDLVVPATGHDPVAVELQGRHVEGATPLFALESPQVSIHRMGSQPFAVVGSLCGTSAPCLFGESTRAADCILSPARWRLGLVPEG